MSAPRTCETCLFFDLARFDAPVGLCRFLPPTAAAVPVPRRNLAGDTQIEVQQINLWSNTRPTDWCAQHQLRAASVATN